MAKRMDAIQGQYGVHRREDGVQGSVFWFAIPYRPDSVTSQIVSSSAALSANANVNAYTAVNARGNPRHRPLKAKGKASFSTPVSYSSRQPLSPLSSHKSLTILVVDDSPTIAKMMVMMLRRQSHKVSIAENGELALRLIEEHVAKTGKGFDLIMMDLQMPVMDGLEATRRLRLWEQSQPVFLGGGPQIILGMSANSDDDTMREAMAAGLTDFIAKPFTLELFMAAVDKHITIPSLSALSTPSPISQE